MRCREKIGCYSIHHGPSGLVTIGSDEASNAETGFNALQNFCHLLIGCIEIRHQAVKPLADLCNG